MEKTAVEWFNQQLVDRQNGNGDSRSRDEIFEQAKEMEKQQMFDYVKNKYVIGEHSLKFHQEKFEKYYNEIFKAE